jgi:thioredoxin reductase (NADPH)
VLSPTLLGRLRTYGSAETVAAGELIYQIGDDSYDLILIESGRVDLLCEPTEGTQPQVISEMGPGDFLGELSLFTGQRIFISARACDPALIHRIGAEAFRALMAQDAELSDIVLTALYQRRTLLKNALGDTVEIIDNENSTTAMELVAYTERMDLPYKWTEASTPRGTAILNSLDARADQLPMVVMPDTVILNATPAQLARHIGRAPTHNQTSPVDLVVIGAGPAGLAATVYGASEGLQTVTLDTVGPGGQAAATSRIENYPGFPNGLSGAELIRRSALQALKFGARLYAPYRVTELAAPTDEPIALTLDDDSIVKAHAVIIATGVRYRTLPLPRWHDFEGRGIYYAATELEARRCTGSAVAIVGGANSAGQAAVFLAQRCGHVRLIVRGDDIRTEMSAYLVERILPNPNITVSTGSEVTAIDGRDHLETLTVTDRSAGTCTTVDCSVLFRFIGARPQTSWCQDILTDTDGFIRTDTYTPVSTSGRRPLPYETSIPGVFAVGDVRSGSMKRIAAATGEGASAVASVHALRGRSHHSD